MIIHQVANDSSKITVCSSIKVPLISNKLTLSKWVETNKRLSVGKEKKSNQDNGAGPVRVRFSCQNIFIYSICLISHCPVSTLKNTDIFLTDDNETS